MTASTGKSVLAIVAILSLVLSLFAIARPVIANHEPPDGPEVTPTAEEFPGGETICPTGSVGFRFNSPVAGDDATVTLADGSSATVTIVSVAGNMLTFEVEGGLAAIVKVKGGVSSPGTPDQNVYDYTGFPGGGIAHDDGLTTPNAQGISHVDFCLVPIEGSIIVYKTDQTQADVAGAEFTVKDGDIVVAGPTDTDANGLVCFDGLVVGNTYSVIETAAPDGWLPADPDTQSIEAVQGSCEDRAGDDPDATFTNTLLGSLLVLKVDDGDPVAPLPGAEFSITGPDGYDETATSDANGWFCLDGLTFGEEYTVTETMAPDGYVIGANNPQMHTIDDSMTCAERLAAEGGPVADLTFSNTREEEPTGSITVVKEVDCEECETRTIGYYFNTADQHEDETNALFDALGGIEADGILFTNVDQVQQYRADDQDGTSDGQNGLSARGQLTLQYLGAVLNVERNGTDCDLASRVYNNADSPFDGWTVAEILAEADAAFDGTSSFSDEDIKSALDDINNSSHEEENPLTCEGSESGTLDGVMFDLYLEADYPEGDPIDSGTTGDDGAGTVVFDGLALDETYVLVESGFPEGMTCEIVDVQGEGFTFTLNEDGSVTIELTADTPDVTLTVVNECEEDEEEELGSLLIAKEDDEGASLGGATFEVDGTPIMDDDEDGFVCVDGLTLGDTVSVEETVAPDGYIGEEGAVNVVILSTDDCATRLAGDPQADADITFVNVPEEDEEEGELEVIKFFCPTEGEDQIFVFGPLAEEPVDFSALGAEEDELPSDEGCTLGAPSEEALGATFTITGGDLAEPLVVITTWEEILTLELAPGDYTIVEEGTGLTADFTIEVDQDTAVVVFNFEEEEAEEGRLKILKFYCVGEGDPVFTVVAGDMSMGDVDLPDNCESPEAGDATFTLTMGESTSGEFTLGDDGARLIPLEVGTYTLGEVDPNEASSDPFDITADATTTAIVFNFAAEGEQPGGGEGPGQNETPREGTQGGSGGPGSGGLPNTALAPTPAGSVPAALLALLMLAGLGAAGYAVRAEAQRRR